MVWRYHPKTRAYEIFAEGGGNNFGLEFDAEGRLYSGHNGGETRGWHYVQSGIYLKQSKDPGKFGPPTNPFAFGELPMLATTNKITRFSHHFAIAEGTALPSNYLGRLFNADPLHGNVVVSERAPTGSTFTTTDTGIALETDDIAFRPVFVANAPDGAIYVADFYEQYIAHGQNYQGQIDPDSGRIYRLRGKSSALNKDVNLERKTTTELIAMLSHSNKWHRQTAVRLLAERRDPSARAPLKKILFAFTDSRLSSSRREEAHSSLTKQEDQSLLTSAATFNAHPALEALWTLHQAEWLDERTAMQALTHPAAPVRAWAIRLVGDGKYLPEEFAAAVTRLAASEPEAEVRCQVASTARRLPAHQALKLVTALFRRDADAGDPFTPLLCWWTLENFCDSERAAVLEIFSRENASVWNSAMVRQHILSRLMRRFASKATRSDLLVCAQLFNAAPGDEHRKLLLAGFEKAFEGRALPPLPDELAKALAAVGQQPLLLRVRQGDAEAIQQALALISDSKAKREDRLVHIRIFGEVHEPAAVPVLLNLGKTDGDLDLRKAALAVLGRYEEKAIGEEIAREYLRLPASLHTAAQILLTSRPAWSLAFLRLVESGTVNPANVAADAVARLRSHSDTAVAELTSKLFPAGSTSSRPDLRATIDKIESALKSGAGNPYAGESIFMERCGSCHQLFHKGGQIGPNLTSYQRDDFGTMLPSILDPSAEIREGYVNYFVETKDGRTLNGFLAEQDANIIVVRGIDGENITLARDEIREIKPAGMSLMPEGLVDDLNAQQLRDFFAYLRIPQPISK